MMALVCVIKTFAWENLQRLSEQGDNTFKMEMS